MAENPRSEPTTAQLLHPGVIAAVIVSVAVTITAVATPVIHFAYRNPPLHVAFETAEVLIGSLAAFLFYGRYKQSRRWSDLGLVFVLDLLAITNIAFSVVPTVLLQGRPDVRHGWVAAAIRLVAIATLVVCARIHFARQTPKARSALVPFAAAGAVVVVLGGVSLSLAHRFPDPLNATIITQTADMLLAGHPVFILMQGLIMVMAGIAAYSFTRSAADQDDELLFWVGAACVFSSFARLNFLLFPSLYTEYVYTGDLLRFGFYAMLLTGGVREIRSFWTSRAEVAVGEERRRFARDLHDGAAQELLFILAQTRRLRAGKGGPEDLEALESAADRAVFESRRAIHALSATADRSLPVALREACEELGRRWGSAIDLEAERIEASDQTTEHLVRIAREAITNAIKHAEPSSIRVSLQTDPRDVEGKRIVLVVEDDGAGFDVDRAAKGSRFGVRSMRERAAALDGQLEIHSYPGDGTRVMASVKQDAI